MSDKETIEESSRIMEKYPTRIPIIVNKEKRCNLPDIDKHKYLVDKHMNIREFIYIIRKRIQLDKSKAMFITINNKMYTSNDMLSKIYQNEKNSNGFLYVTYSTENTFG